MTASERSTANPGKCIARRKWQQSNLYWCEALCSACQILWQCSCAIPSQPPQWVQMLGSGDGGEPGTSIIHSVAILQASITAQ